MAVNRRSKLFVGIGLWGLMFLKGDSSVGCDSSGSSAPSSFQFFNPETRLTRYFTSLQQAKGLTEGVGIMSYLLELCDTRYTHAISYECLRKVVEVWRF